MKAQGPQGELQNRQEPEAELGAGEGQEVGPEEGRRWGRGFLALWLVIAVPCSSEY